MYFYIVPIIKLLKMVTLWTDKYYRGIKKSMDDTKYKLQLASMELKINENKNDINGIKSDISIIDDFSDDIGTNTSNTSSNLKK